jgi:aryl-alcohol dehydrogenase-like predicted oxidoreductase
MTPFGDRTLGSTGRRVGPLGLGSSYGLGGKDVERAFDRGVSFFLWGSRRRPDFARGLREIARKDRERATIAIQTYARAAWAMPGSVDAALKALGTDYVDVLCLAWWNSMPPARIVDRALALEESGKVRHLMISCHDRPVFASVIADGRYDALMVRYNAAHPGPEHEVFPHVAAAARRPGVVAFTATRWGTLLDPKYAPARERVPRAGDCYRFALTHPEVDVCLSGPRDGAELDEALAALELGIMSADEIAWMRRVGAHVRTATKTQPRGSVMGVLDRIATWGGRRGACSSTPRLPHAPM